MACSGQAAARDCSQFGPPVICGAHGARGFDKADVALDGVQAHALILCHFGHLRPLQLRQAL